AWICAAYAGSELARARSMPATEPLGFRASLMRASTVTQAGTIRAPSGRTWTAAAAALTLAGAAGMAARSPNGSIAGAATATPSVNRIGNAAVAVLRTAAERK